MALIKGNSNIKIKAIPAVIPFTKVPAAAILNRVFLLNLFDFNSLSSISTNAPNPMMKKSPAPSTPVDLTSIPSTFAAIP